MTDGSQNTFTCLSEEAIQRMGVEEVRKYAIEATRAVQMLRKEEKGEPATAPSAEMATADNDDAPLLLDVVKGKHAVFTLTGGGNDESCVVMNPYDFDLFEVDTVTVYFGDETARINNDLESQVMIVLADYQVPDGQVRVKADSGDRFVAGCKVIVCRAPDVPYLTRITIRMRMSEPEEGGHDGVLQTIVKPFFHEGYMHRPATVGQRFRFPSSSSSSSSPEKEEEDLVAVMGVVEDANPQNEIGSGLVLPDTTIHLLFEDEVK